MGKHAQALGRAPVAAMSGFQIALVQDCPELVDSVEKVVFWFGALVFAVRFELENSARLRSCNVRRPRFPSCGCLVCLLIACRTTLGDAERAACNLSGPCIIPFHGYDRDIRPFCIGRFSWLFSDTVAGAKANPMVYSLMLTCRTCNVEPYAYSWTRSPSCRSVHRMPMSPTCYPSTSRSSRLQQVTPVDPTGALPRTSPFLVLDCALTISQRKDCPSVPISCS
ncbi:hypothetical protein P3T22_003909 [Paraburkholderia sp. GAS348]